MRLIDAHDIEYEHICGEFRVSEEKINAMPTIFEISDNATNGDVIEKIFNTTSTQFCELVRMDNIDNGLCCSLDW